MKPSVQNLSELPGIRESVRAQVAEMGRDGFFIHEQELRFLLMMRAIGFGKCEVNVVDGRPATLERVIEKIDLSKEPPLRSS